MKNIKPHKVIIEFDEKGKFKDGIIIYQTIDDSGFMDPKINTISFKTEVNVPVINGIIDKSIRFAEKKERKNG